jgi:hypothetical protein
MIANFYEKGGSKNHGEKAQDAKEALPHENVHLLSSSEPTGDVDVDTDELVSRNQRTPSMADDVERKMGDLKLTAQYSNRSSKKSGKNELEPPLSEVDLLSFGEDGKQSDYLDLPLAKDENHSTV